MTEEELIGTLAKLKKRESDLFVKVSNLTNYHSGPFNDAFDKKYSADYNDPERTFKAEMNVNPDKIIALATELKALQKEYADAHAKTREFEKAYPIIAKICDKQF
jgi:hypothetical protein